MATETDCLIVGAGPAGLTAAIYLARFRLSVAMVDNGHSRAALIPLTRNHAGFPDGVPGTDLLERMRRQAAKYGADVSSGTIQGLSRDGELFVASLGHTVVRSRTVLLATGVFDRRPPMSDDLHAQSVAQGRLRYCPVCDGYEVIDQEVGVLGTGEKALKEAAFIRSYTQHVTMVSVGGAHQLTEDERERCTRLNIKIVEGPAAHFHLVDGGLSFETASGCVVFESVYAALGTDIRSGLARDLEADCSDEGCIRVDSHQRTSVAGLFAAGDVVSGLDQISHAMGQAGVAATTIRNELTQARPLLR